MLIYKDTAVIQTSVDLTGTTSDWQPSRVESVKTI